MNIEVSFMWNRDVQFTRTLGNVVSGRQKSPALGRVVSLRTKYILIRIHGFLFVCLFVLSCSSHSRILHSFGVVISTGEGLHI